MFGGIGYVGGRRAAPRIAGAIATVLMGAFIAYDITENTCGYRALPNLVLGALWIIPPVTLAYLDWWWFWYVLGVPPLAAGIAMLGFARGRHIRWRAANAGPPRCDACGYLLIGLSEPRCPECGAPFELAAAGEMQGDAS